LNLRWQAARTARWQRIQIAAVPEYSSSDDQHANHCEQRLLDDRDALQVAQKRRGIGEALRRIIAERFSIALHSRRFRPRSAGRWTFAACASSADIRLNGWLPETSS